MNKSESKLMLTDPSLAEPNRFSQHESAQQVMTIATPKYCIR